MNLPLTITCALALALSSTGPVAATSTTGVTVEISLATPDTIEVAYRLPPECRHLPLSTPFDKRWSEVFRATWTGVGACGVLDDGALAPTPACRELRFRVPTSTETQDRIYPPAYPIASLGIYLHTGAFAPTEACGAVQWRFVTNDGEVVFDGKTRGPHYNVLADDAGNPSFTSVYLALAPLASGSRPVTIFSPHVPPWAVDSLQSASIAVEDRYQVLTGAAGFRAPATVVSNVEGGERPFVKADVANQRMLRIGLKNYGKVQDSEANRRLLRGLIAHEFAHSLQDETLGSAETAWLAEGGADFMRWMTLYRLGWRDKTQSVADFQDSMTQCLEAMGGRPWAAQVDRRIPYTCGFIIHVLALSSRQQSGVSSEEALIRFYKARRADRNASPALWLECGGTPACTPQTLPRLLSPEATFAAAFVEEARRLGIATADTDPTAPSEAIRQRGRFFAAIMEKDCGGGYSFNNLKDKIVVVPANTCKLLLGGEELVAFAGVPFTDPQRDATEAGRKECAEQHALTLGLAHATALRVPCPDALPPQIPRLKVDQSRLLGLVM